MGLADEVMQHSFGNFKFGNDAIAQGPNNHNMRGGFTAHLFCFLAICDRAPRLFFDSRVRWLVDDDPFAAHTDQCIGGAEINADVQRKQA